MREEDKVGAEEQNLKELLNGNSCQPVAVRMPTL